MIFENAGTDFRFGASGARGPKIEVELFVSDNIEQVIRNIPLSDSTTLKTDAYCREASIAFQDVPSSDSLLNVGISHVHTLSSDNFGCENNFRLNLHERLEKTGENAMGGIYVYTDETGWKYRFQNRYYYLDGNNKKVDVLVSNVTVNVDGTYEYNGHKVFLEQRTAFGLQITAKIEGVKGAQYIEQRTEEQKQVEEQYTAYKNELSDYELVTQTNGDRVARLSASAGVLTRREIDNFTALITSGRLLLSRSEAVQYRALLEQDSQQQQIDLFRESRERREEQFKQYAKEYLNLQYQCEQLKRQAPVHFLTDGKIYKGFNESGQLVAIYDGYDNTLMIEYDDTDKIVRVYDGENEQISLSYNPDGLLESITDTRGRRTEYGYDSAGNLTVVTRPNGKTMQFEYNAAGNITSVSEEGEKTVLLYDGGLSKVTRYSTVSEISHGNIVPSAETVLSWIQVSCSGDYTIFTDQDGNRVYYGFSEEGEYVSYFEETNGVVSKAERYSYEAYSHRTTEIAGRSLLNRKPFQSFLFEGDTEKTEITLDQFNNPLKAVTSGQTVSADTTATTTTLYEYDEEHRCIKETATVALSGGANNSYVSVSTCAYNAAGNVVRSESWVEGEEYTVGKDIEEKVYDERGNLLKSFHYNSLDSSSKFYTESVYAENGQVTADLDETGEVSAEYEYIEGTAVVRSVKYPNGSRFAYGHDADDTVTAITQSTAEGEENSTQRIYTGGEVTKLVSGNNTVTYSYDWKRRVKEIFLNDETPYESYSYSEGSAQDSTIVTNAKNERFLTVSDKRGNVQSISYNSTLQVVYTYDKDGNVLTVSDKVSGEESENTYDSLGNLVTYTRGDYTESYAYDAYGKVTEYAQGTRVYSYSYKNNSERDLDHITVEGITVTPETDVLGRNKGKEISGANGKIAGEYLYYRKVGDHATDMPSAVYFGGMQNGRYVIRDNVKYEYDRRGNICKIFENGALSVRYEYDSIDRLTREDNKKLGFTVLFAYDNCGNIISRRQTSFTLKTDVEECESTYPWITASPSVLFPLNSSFYSVRCNATEKCRRNF